MRYVLALLALLPGCLTSVLPARAQIATTPPAQPGLDAILRDPSETSALPEDPAAAAQRVHQQRMRGCAVEWHARKRAGKTGGQSWKDFNAGCLKK